MTTTARFAAAPDVDYDRAEHWSHRAACRGAETELFFPHSADMEALVIARWCRHCPVKQDCGRYAVVTDQRFGVWGGMTSRELAAKRRRYVGG